MQADEELLLLEAVDMFGLGNWAAIGEHVGTKSQEECRAHYNSVYINSPAFPEPTPLPSMANLNRVQVMCAILQMSQSQIIQLCCTFLNKSCRGVLAAGRKDLASSQDTHKLRLHML